MLDRGARTFWEEFPEEGEDDLAMYGRPFGRSLSHGWSAGPAALLPELVLGVRPAADGWSAFTVDPELGDLDWAEAVVPVPTGDLTVRCDGDATVVDVPPGTVLVHRGERHGPGRHRLVRPTAPAAAGGGDCPG
jgi:alpha-L-rhamnosidase